MIDFIPQALAQRFSDGVNLRETTTHLPSSLPTLGLENVNDPVSLLETVMLNYIITPLFFLAGGVAVIVILYASFRLITARGEEDAVTAAKNTLIWAVVGLGLIMVSYTIVRNLAQIILNVL